MKGSLVVRQAEFLIDPINEFVQVLVLIEAGYSCRVLGTSEKNVFFAMIV